MLRSLTNAQKRANTTRGSTPGLKEVAGKEEDLLDGKNTLNVTSDLDYGREADDKAAEVTAPVNKPAHSHRSAITDALYSSQARQGMVIGRYYVTSPMKRKRENVDELRNCIYNEDGRRRKRMRQGSPRASEEAEAESKRYGIPLDPALFTDTSIAPAPSHYGSALSESDAGRIFYPTGGYSVSGKCLTSRFHTAKQPQSAA
ncbi:hypothetical protein MMC22_001466 [Lobaria immixta]|nr:hypothetical protein [Lobaria immixta]